MLKLFGLSSGEKPLPPDKLQVQHLVAGRQVFAAQSGVPSTADSLTYDAVQRLLAVATEEGRVIVVGNDGVELLLGNNSTGAATQQLLFVANRGSIVRLDKAGVLQLFSTDLAAAHDEDEPGRPLATLVVEGDKVCCLATLPREPYILLGCSSGDIKAAALVNASGTLVTEARQVRGLQLTPYSIVPKRLDAAGAVSSLSVLCQAPYQHLLAVHEESGAAVWDLRAQVLVARIKPSSSGQITAAAWLYNSNRGTVATGHASGDVNIWSLTAGRDQDSSNSNSTARSWQSAASNGQEQLKPQLLEQLRVVPQQAMKDSRVKSRKDRTADGNEAAAASGKGRLKPVHALQHVPGRTESLLVFGGAEQDKPDGLVLLPLPEPKLGAGIEDPTTQDEQQQTAAAAAYRLPWLGPICGHALVPPQGSILDHDPPNSLLVLLEGGQVFVHELAPVTGIAADGSSTAAASTAVESGANTTTAAAVGGAGAGLTGLQSRGSQGSPERQRQQGLTTDARQQQQQPQQNLVVVPPQRLFARRLQGQPLVTAARLRIIPIDRVPLSGLQGACMTSLHAWASSNRSQAAQSTCGWILTGGTAAKPATSSTSSSYATLYCTGHADGGVALWEMHSAAPRLLGTAPSSAARQALKAQGLAKAAPVSTLEVAWEQGLLVSGHEGGEVRVYQFSEAAKRIDCVKFESVGSRSNNEGMMVQEPPGFQLRLLTRLHSSDIVSSAYLPQFKMVVVSDRTGSVSLIDLARPAVPWTLSHRCHMLSKRGHIRFQAPWANQPVVSLALGHVPLPAKKDRHPALVAAGGAAATAAAGAKVRAVVAVAADSQMTVLDAETGFFLSRDGILVPKHASAAVHVELLDASGAPTWMSRDVDDLIALAQQTQQHKRDRMGGGASTTRSISASRTMATSNSRATTAAAAGGGGREDEAGSGGGETSDSEADEEEAAAGGGAVESHEAEEVDVDDLLARAAAQVEAQGSRSKARHKKKVTSAQGSFVSEQDASSFSKRERSKSRSRSPGKKVTAATAGATEWASYTASSSAPDAIVLSEPLAEYVLVATQNYLRLYTMSHVAAADRTTCKRVSIPGTLQFASSFAAQGAPALVCLLQLSDEVHLQVYTLPSLELVRDMPLSSLLGWTWSWDPRHTSTTRSLSANLDSSSPSRALQQFINQPAGSGQAAAQLDAVCSSRLAAVCAATRHGHLALLGPGSELVRLALAAGAAGGPAPPEAVYDWDLATAAHAAAAAVERQHHQAWVTAVMASAAAADAVESRQPGQLGSVRSSSPSKQSRNPEETAADVAGTAEEDGAVTGAKMDFKGFMNKIGDGLQQAGKGVAGGFQKAFDETQKGLQKVAQVLEDEMLLTGKPIRPAVPEYPYPTLAAIFAGPAPGAGGSRKKLEGPSVRVRSPKNSYSGYDPAASKSPTGGSPTRPRSTTPTGSAAAAAGVFERPASPAAAAGARSGSVHAPVAAAYERGPSPAAVAAAAERMKSTSAAGTSNSRNLRPAGAAGGSEEAARAELFAASASSNMGPSSSRVESQGGRLSGGGAGARQQQLEHRTSGAAAGGAAKVRSADDIRQAYGRAPLQKSNEVRGVMEETRAALAARGERLSQLSEKTNDLADSAAGFAELAKQLADKERSKAKWFG